MARAYTRSMLIAEKLLLLLLTDSGSREARASSMAPVALRAALLVDLVQAGRIRISEDKKKTVHIVDASLTGHPVLDAALIALAPKDGRRIGTIAQWGGLRALELAADSLKSAGILGETKGGLFNWFTRYPTLDPAPEAALRAHLEAVVRGEAPAEEDDGVLLGVLQAMNATRVALPKERIGLSAREVKRRIKILSEGDPASTAARAAVDAASAAVIAAVASSSAAAGAAGAAAAG
ncbi:Golgi phosphoprotein 3-like protein [Actinomyces sp. Chiba101]|uniref:Golgi phosphoprotein 3 (GPP34) n=2 Tax=Actinomycetaceae TaxID=2049 RepID=A0ABY1IF01_9ACTO|nr:Golgi phosphoprotein 3-like protein [Actinomyces sp. Chiba101]GAV95067.1 hypothetical protein ADENT20671_1845 [Actinomyces denticolens]SHJ07869.1 Golgi phosphoprotein 3 (GPP34) [Actinomyces denticolens]SUU12052.1 Uncharacterised protein [Actinomyces denticolens]